MEQEHGKRPPKKTRSIEVRVSEEEREAFLERCQLEDQPASAVLREAMAQYARTGPAALHKRSRFMTFSIAASVLALSAALQSSPLELTPGQPYGLAEFELYDLNGNDVLTEREYRQAFSSQRVYSEAGAAPLRAQYHGMVIGSFYGGGYSGPLPHFEQSFDQISADCWNAIDREMSAGLAVRFHGMDSDGDRRVTAQEFSDAKLRQIHQLFEDLDRNADQRLTVEDLGRLSAPEVPGPAARQSRPAESAPETFRDARPDFLAICGPEFEALPSAGQSRAALAPPDPHTVFAQHYAPFDANGDGALVFAEFAESMNPTY